MTKQSYYEKLKDPRWQKKRLEALQSKDFCCEICLDNEKTLNVHHKEYLKNYEPWEYDVDQLAVLCEECHENYHLSNPNLLKMVCSYLDLEGPQSRDSAAILLAGFIGMDYDGIMHFSGLSDCPGNKDLYKKGQAAREFNVCISLAGRANG